MNKLIKFFLNNRFVKNLDSNLDHKLDSKTSKQNFSHKVFTKAIFVGFLFISSCNFQVIYKDQYDENSLANQMASIVIKARHNKLFQILKNNLYDVLNPDIIKVREKYSLEMTLSTSVNPTYTNNLGGSGRNKVTLFASYVLKNINNKKTISSGKTEVFDSYDVSTNRYGSYVSEEFVQENLTKIVAQNIRNSIVSDLIEEINNCQKNKNNKDYQCLVELDNS